MKMKNNNKKIFAICLVFIASSCVLNTTATPEIVLGISLNALDIGHNIEKFFVFELKNVLKNAGVNSNIIISKIDTDPYKFV